MAITCRYLILLLACLNGAMHLHAFAPSILDDEPTIPLRFYYLNAASEDVHKGVAPIEFIIQSGDTNVACSLVPSGVSATVDYRGPTPVSVFTEHKTDKGVVREPLGQIAFPAQWKGAFFIVTKAPPGSAEAFRFYPIEYWGPSLPDHHARVVNLCPLPLAVKLAGSLAMVPASGTADVDITHAVVDLPIMMALQRDTRWQMLMSSALPAPRSQRMLLLAFPDAAAANSVRTLVLDELPEPPAATLRVAFNR
jgi:hypothetical protein